MKMHAFKFLSLVGLAFIITATSGCNIETHDGNEDGSCEASGGSSFGHVASGGSASSSGGSSNGGSGSTGSATGGASASSSGGTAGGLADCSSDTDCDSDSFCNANLCTPAEPCSSESDCGIGFNCAAESGLCLPAASETCAELSDEAACSDRDECEVIYAGVDCSCGAGCECMGGEPGCVCASFEFFRCEALAN